MIFAFDIHSVCASIFIPYSKKYASLSYVLLCAIYAHPEMAIYRFLPDAKYMLIRVQYILYQITGWRFPYSAHYARTYISNGEIGGLFLADLNLKITAVAEWGTESWCFIFKSRDKIFSTLTRELFSEENFYSIFLNFAIKMDLFFQKIIDWRQKLSTHIIQY
jgi:hypothetical protein